MLTTHLHQAPRLRMNGATLLLHPVYLHGMDRDNFTLSFYQMVLLSLTLERQKCSDDLF
jgi:hypothetical protein